MRSNVEVLREIKSKEEILGLYKIRVLGVPLWRLLRFRIRIGKLKRETGFTNKTTKAKIDIVAVVKNYFISFFQFVKLLLGNQKYENLVFAFPRLVKYDAVYFDKFTDPVIAQSNLKGNTLVVQRNLGGKQLKPRLSDDAVVVISDFIDYSAKVFAMLFFPLFYILYASEIKELYGKASQYFELNKKFKIATSLKIGAFCFQVQLWKLMLTVLKCKNCIVVDRAVFLSQICACKERKIPVFELQHGVTLSESALYTGNYQQEIDADYFLAFGRKWIGTQFGMPVEKIHNIGWAYKSWLQDKLDVQVEKNRILVVSSPAITESIVKTTIELAEHFVSCQFVLRLHPQEALTQKQKDRLKVYGNICIDDNEKDAIFAILQSEYCIGENSSVLYEALSYGKKVGKLMYNGLNEKINMEENLGFSYLKRKADFEEFISSATINIENNGIYDNFECDKFEKLTKIER